jgi:hypothetical protein
LDYLARQAAADWEAFLRARASDLTTGGRLLVQCVDPLAAGLAAAGLIAALYAGLPSLRAKKDFLGSPLAYAALAQERLV